MIIETDSCRYTFTKDEKLKFAERMGESAQKKAELEAELETFKAQHRSKIAVVEEEYTLSWQRLNAGYEMRPTKLLVLKFRPTTEELLMIRLDTGYVHLKRKLTADEKQMKLSTKKPDDFVWLADFSTDTEVSEVYAHVPLTLGEGKQVEGFEHVHLRQLRLTLAAGKGDKCWVIPR